MLKTCAKCGTAKQREDFNNDRRRRDGKFPWCKVCHRAHSSKYRQEVGKAEINLRQAATRAKRNANNEARSKYLSYIVIYSLNRRYGITVPEVLRLAEHQCGVCAICGAVPDPKKRRGGLCVDHDHATGQVRGLLCGRCNTGIGYLRDDPELLRIAQEYLREPPARSIGLMT